MVTVPPSPDTLVGVVGRGFISVLTAKLAAKAGYKTWLLVPNGQLDVVNDLLGEDSEADNVPPNLECIAGSDTE